jgi:hypothetical protein
MITADLGTGRTGSNMQLQVTLRLRRIAPELRRYAKNDQL